MTIEIPNREELDAHFRQFCIDSDYLNSIWPQVKKDYPDQYVAVYKGEIVATHKKLKRLLAIMNEKDVPPNYAAVRFAASKPRKLIL
ncbi:MAG: DUF5678 domain-containing protein [Chloroflexota bacterium]|nr:DUF5678 domain-containing protein [Chloroflexota bacterium]MDE2885078.1 DUF5678 domain-containing protein [Chloroflexota bacterium]